MPRFLVHKGHDAWVRYEALVEADTIEEANKIAGSRLFTGWIVTGDVDEFDHRRNRLDTDRITQLENFVNQMAGMSLPEEEFENLREEYGVDEFGDVKADEWGSVTYADDGEYVADLCDERLMDGFGTLTEMIREARRLAAY